jgi:hypothetical protein
MGVTVIEFYTSGSGYILGEVYILYLKAHKLQQSLIRRLGKR